MSDNFNDNPNEFEDYSNVKEFKWWERIKYLFVNPNELFKSVKFYPSTKLPIALIIISTLVAAFIEMNTDEFINSIAENMPGMTPSDSVLTGYMILTVILTPIVPIFIVFFKAFMVNGLAALVGGDGEYKDAIAIAAYSYVPVAVGRLILTIIFVASGNPVVDLNLALILPESMIGSIVYGAFLHFDILIIWYQILVLIGATYLYEIPKKKAFVPVILPWIVWIILSSGLYVLNHS
ncbi:YIP1 family protein [Clostridium sp. D2Q-14]|uniref:YIP1 family protein n=1 Tax=Anaeromonas gelatinilytica TaxID=2683194 RepID=UPI00193BDF04|nr:YIP1 family protein [Anaeromonas gelatinilytica]MBS4534642.1 YIP1 family protein [Anaeromonas gelatinilytica]